MALKVVPRIARPSITPTPGGSTTVAWLISGLFLAIVTFPLLEIKSPPSPFSIKPM